MIPCVSYIQSSWTNLCRILDIYVNLITHATHTFLVITNDWLPGCFPWRNQTLETNNSRMAGKFLIFFSLGWFCWYFSISPTQWSCLLFLNMIHMCTLLNGKCQLDPCIFLPWNLCYISVCFFLAGWLGKICTVCMHVLQFWFDINLDHMAVSFWLRREEHPRGCFESRKYIFSFSLF